MKLIEALEIINRGAGRGPGVQRFFLACGFTPLHLRTFLHAHLQARFADTRVEVDAGIYGDLAGNLERARAAAPAGAAVVVEWPDLDARLGLRQLGGWSPEILPDIAGSVQAARSRIEAQLEGLAEVCPVALCLPTLGFPPAAFTAGWQASRFEIELEQQAFCLAARAANHPRIRVLNPQRLAQLSAVSERRDTKSELQTGFPYRQPHAEAVGRLLSALLENPAPKKGLITDLDDTLWRGILGEAGVQGISWDLAGHSQVHGVYQQFLDALAARGILIGVASKNDPALVEEAFGRADLRLAKSRVFPVQANWGPKSDSVRQILAAWNIAADSVVFVDDSPMELAEVRGAHPGIECFAFPKDDPTAVLELLERLRDLFGKSAISEEDKIRGESIRAAGELHTAASAGGSALDEFLSGAGAEMTLELNGPDHRRAFELVNKTNQFNLNGRRYTESEWQSYLCRPGAFLLRVSYQDKFGPLGGIAAVLGRKLGSRLSIDTWVMSCRAFARRIEHQCLRQLFAKFAAEEIVFDFRDTPRNGPLREFLAAFGTPEPQFRLDRGRFEAACPPLFHCVKESSDV